MDPWEWDEVLFTSAVEQGLDIRDNRPHAPGYPLFVEAGQALRAAGLPPFRAVTLAATVGAALAPPAAAFLAASCGLSVPFSVLAGLLYAFVPSVWLHGVRPLTDGTATAFLLLSLAFAVRFLRGGGTRLVPATLVAAAAAVAVRPQSALSLLPVCLVVVAVSVRKGKEGLRAAGLGVVLAAGLCLAAFLPLVRGSGGLAPTLAQIREQRDLTTEGDAATAGEFATAAFWLRWFRDPYGRSPLALGVFLLAAAGAAARPREAGRLALAYLPVLVPTLALQNDFAAPRYAAILLPLPSVLAALGLEAIGAALPGGRIAAALLGAAVLAAEAGVGAPRVFLVSSSPSPPGAVLAALSADPSLASRRVVVDGRLLAHAQARRTGRRALLMPAEGETVLRPDELFLAADRDLLGGEPLARASFDDPLLPRLTLGRLLSVAAYDGAKGTAIVPARSDGGASIDARSGSIDLPPGGSVSLSSRGAVVLRARIGAPAGAELVVETQGGPPQRFREGGSAPGEVLVEVVLQPSPEGSLGRLSSSGGPVALHGLRLVPLAVPAEGESLRVDIGLPGSVDAPVRGSVVRGTLIARGWAREKNGGLVEPFEFLLDGERIVPVSVRRTRRKDVSVFVPGTGDPDGIGWEADFAPIAAGRAGSHALVVVFRTADGRVRAYDPIRFTWE